MKCLCEDPIYSCPIHTEHVVVRIADLRHLLDVYIENGMVEAEDEEIVNRLWAHLSDGSPDADA